MSLSSLVSRSLTAAALALGSVLVAAPAPAAAASSPEYRITPALPGDQVRSHLALGPAGGWLVWQDNAVTPQGVRIRAQQLSAAGTATEAPPLTLSSVATKRTTGEQANPQVAILDNGGALIVWQGGTPGKQFIYSRLLSPYGTFAAKRDVRVSNARATKKLRVNEAHPAIAKLTDGSLVVVWSDVGRDGSMQGVFAQLFQASGVRVGPSFPVNQYWLYNQRSPAVAALGNGNFVVAWISEQQRGEGSVDAYARLFNASGIALNNEVPLNSSTTNICANPSVAALPTGGFAVAWSQQDAPTRTLASNPFDPTDAPSGPSAMFQIPAAVRSTDSWDVFGVVCGASGELTGPAFRLNTHTYGEQFAPQLVAAGDGLLAVWTSLGQDGSREGIFGQFLAADGGFRGGEFGVNQTTRSRQFQPAVTTTGAGHAIVVWSSFGAGTSFDLFARTFQAASEQ